MTSRVAAIAVVCLLVTAATAAADTVRVVVDRALVWTQPSGVSIVMTQMLKDQKAEVVRRVGDWYEIVAPPGSGGGDRRTGFIAATQVVLEPDEASSGRPARDRSPRQGVSRPSRESATPGARRARLVHIDAGLRQGNATLTRSVSAFAETYAEAGTIRSDYAKRSGFVLNGFFVQPLWQGLGVGVGASYYTRKRAASVQASVPHPFFFNQPRDASFESDALAASEAAVHVSAAWRFSNAGPLTVLIFGGPSVFRVTQTVVTDVNLDDEYPFDTVTITGVRTADRSGTRFGYHAGADVSWFFNPSVGVGGGVRYSRAALKFDNDQGVDTTGDAGGIDMLAGLRVRF